ncbi:MAG: DUF4367 domain-containing protein [Cellulosilyticaceae bacterium]
MNKKSDSNELKQIEALLMNADVGSSKCEERIFNRLKYKIETETINLNEKEKDEPKMKKKFLKPSTVATLTIATLIGGASITYGGEILSSMIARFQVGHTEITQYGNDNQAQVEDIEVNELSLEDMQVGFKGKLFDKNGNDALYGEHQDYYTEDGKWITSMMVKDLPNGGYEFVVSTEEEIYGDSKVLTIEEVKEAAHKNIALPTYLPQGYSFKEAITSHEGAGVNAVYENQAGESIVLLASATKEATSGVVTTDEVTQTTISGQKVTLSTNCAFWEAEDVSYQLYWNLEEGTDGQIPSMDMQEVSKIIGSMK